jgi:biotin carboxyl carrier protein
MKTYQLKINEKKYTVEIESLKDEKAEVICNGNKYIVEFETPEKVKKAPMVARKVAVPTSDQKKTYKPSDNASSNAVKAPIPGIMTAILVSEGDMVESGQVIAKMEAMKMENNILASVDGKITKILVKVGDTVLEGDMLMDLEDA